MNLPALRLAPLVLLASTRLAAGHIWVDMPASWPAARAGHSMAFDGANGRIVVVGGGSTAGLPDHWEYDWSSWEYKKPPSQMGPRTGHAMVYDPRSQRIVLFGGREALDVYLGDTWLYDGDAWVPGPASPRGMDPREGHAMTYDATRGVVVVFGGKDRYRAMNDTWEWDGTAWRRGPWGPYALSGRWGHAMAHDPALRTTIVFGGRDFVSGDLAETWRYDGFSWTPAVAPGPVPRLDHRMVYDPFRGAILMAGGTSTSGALADVWEYRSGSWTPGPTMPPEMGPRSSFGMAIDSLRQSVVVFAGTGPGGQDAQLWELTSAGWAAGPTSTVVIPSPRGEHSLAYDGRRQRVVLFGGYSLAGAPPHPDDTWEYDGNAWTRQAAPGPPGRYGTRMSYDAARQKVVLFGGKQLGYPVFADTWEYDGAWSRGPDAPSAMGGRRYPSMVYDTRRQRTVLVGGDDYYPNVYHDVWEYDGSSWQPGTGPPATMAVRLLPAAAYDAARGVMVVFGGRDVVTNELLDDTWEFDGSAWRQVPQLAPPPARQYGQTVYDSRRQLAVLFGGMPDLNDTWTFDGSRWSPAGLPSPTMLQLSSPALAYDEARDRAVAMSSLQAAPAFSVWEYRPGPVIAAGAGDASSNPNLVRAFEHPSGTQVALELEPYAAGAWGVHVGAGDVNGGGLQELLTAPGPGDTLGPHIRAFDRTGTALSKLNFYAYGTLRFGANVAGGTVDNDPFAEVLTGAGPGAVFGPQVRGFNFDGTALAPISRLSFFAYGTLRYGVNAASGDLEPDGYEELVTGPGPGPTFAPQVRAFNYDALQLTPISRINFLAFAEPGFGAVVASSSVHPDPDAELVAAAGPGPSLAARVRGFDDDSGRVEGLPGFERSGGMTRYGARVALHALDLGPTAILLVSPGPDPSAATIVRASRYEGGDLTAYGDALAPVIAFPNLSYGANPAGVDLGL